MKILLRNPGFVPNTDSDKHCLHACLLMALRSSPHDGVPSIDELDKEMRTDPTLYSWPFSLMRILVEKNFDIIHIEQFDSVRFSKDPETYLITEYGEEVGNDQIKNSNLDIVVDDLNKIIELTGEHVFEKRQPGTDTLKKLIDDGYYCLCNVNQRILQGESGYVGHMIFIYGYSDQGFIAHNPGPPYSEETVLSYVLFENAWAYPDNVARNVLAVQKIA